MKKIMNYTLGMMCMLLSSAAFSQSQPVAADQAHSQMMMKDLNTRNPKTMDQTVDWRNTDYGYSGMYSVDNENYMTRYDKKGNYVETLTKKDWNDGNVPTDLKTSFDKSMYKDAQVTSYWQVSDANQKGYYIEMNDSRGKSSNMWVDGSGKFTATPYTTKPIKTKGSN